MAISHLPPSIPLNGAVINNHLFLATGVGLLLRKAILPCVPPTRTLVRRWLLSMCVLYLCNCAHKATKPFFWYSVKEGVETGGRNTAENVLTCACGVSRSSAPYLASRHPLTFVPGFPEFFKDTTHSESPLRVHVCIQNFPPARLFSVKEKTHIEDPCLECSKKHHLLHSQQYLHSKGICKIFNINWKRFL